MTTKYFVDNTGKYLGGFSGSEPQGGIEVPTAPAHAGQRWVDNAWTGTSVPVPSSITPLQARKALRQFGLQAQVKSYVEQLSEEEREEWEFAISIERDNAIIAGGAAALGLTANQVDQLFILGATL